MTDLKELKALAMRATKGPWFHKSGLSDEEAGVPGGAWPALIVEDEDGDYVLTHFSNSENPEEDIAFVAASNPQAILSLIERIEKIESALAGIFQLIDEGWLLENGLTGKERDKVERAREALK